MEISYNILVAACFCYGFSTMISEWYDFWGKLVNTLIIIALVVLAIFVMNGGWFRDWYDLIIPFAAFGAGSLIEELVFDNYDWKNIGFVLTIVAIIACIITAICGV